RRVLWASTNNVYKTAARLYKQKQKTIKDYNIDYKLADFSREKPADYIENSTLTLADQQKLDDMVVEISRFIDEHDSIYLNAAIISDLVARKYYHNSEGTTMITNHQVTQIGIAFNVIDEEEHINIVNVSYSGTGLNDLPTIEEIKKDLVWNMNNVKAKSSVKELEEDYNGPVLIEGRAVALFFISKLFKTNKGIFTNRNAFSNKDEQAVKRFFEELEKDMIEDDDLKIGNDQLIVTSHPFLEEFDGQELAGSYKIDAEGVIPSEKLVLIKDGMIKQKLNGRIPAPNAESSTGSNRPLLTLNGMGKAIAPGVIKVDFKEKVAEAELMAKFKEEIVDNGEEYGIIMDIPDLKHARAPRQYHLYKVDDDSKTNIRKASFSWLGKNHLKKIIAVSDEYYVYNFQYSGNSYGGSPSGIPATIIVPKSIVIRDMDVNKTNPKGIKPDMIVPIPGSSR
ncbi:MAG: hypothetical protein WBA74_22950, partial [Cyclobacteriaceae bacterium]